MRDQFFEFLHRSGSLEMKETAAAVRGDSVAENFQKGLLRRGKKTLENLLDSFFPSPLPPLKTQRNQCPHFHPLLLLHNHNLFFPFSLPGSISPKSFLRLPQASVEGGAVLNPFSFPDKRTAAAVPRILPPPPHSKWKKALLLLHFSSMGERNGTVTSFLEWRRGAAPCLTERAITQFTPSLGPLLHTNAAAADFTWRKRS